MKARILDTWDMELPEVTENPWFVDWVHRSPKQAGDHLEVSWKTFVALANHFGSDAFPVIREYFGGIGAHALMLDQLFDPHHHMVADFSPEAVEHMKRVLPADVHVMKADAYDPDYTTYASLQVLDFGDLTVWKAAPGSARGSLLTRVFEEQPLAVTITDIAARYLHLQKQNYEPILGPGTCDTYEDYLAAFAEHIEDRYGYSLLEANYTRWSAVMAFIPSDGGGVGKINKHTSRATGLVLV